ncbi:hypothetical protein BpHYR1_031564 [Brachionus plicatilis]|uniref:Uncharacterized protein n=1 Tax=Brachionus plicatilis TaxID=10195 RepID=A0A3M7P5W2_BRAPC|nr:hypothetical protein BpHYR1_031564 [Brachionus plicatilis]
MIKETTTATHGFPDFVLPYLTNFSNEPKISSSAKAFKTLELPIAADNSPEKVVATMPIGISASQNTMDWST